MMWTLFQGHSNSGRNMGGFRFYARSTVIVTIIQWKDLTERSPFSAPFHWRRTVTSYCNVMNDGQFWMGVRTAFLPCLLCKWLIPCCWWEKTKTNWLLVNKYWKYPIQQSPSWPVVYFLVLCVWKPEDEEAGVLWIYSATVDCEDF